MDAEMDTLYRRTSASTTRDLRLLCPCIGPGIVRTNTWQDWLWKVELWAMKPSRSSMGLGCGMPNWPPQALAGISRTCASPGDALASLLPAMPLSTELLTWHSELIYHVHGSGSAIGIEQPKH